MTILQAREIMSKKIARKIKGEIELTKKGERMLKEALKEMSEGKFKKFDNILDLMEELHKK